MPETFSAEELNELPSNHAPKAIRGVRSISLIIDHEKSALTANQPTAFVEQLEAIQSEAQNLEHEFLITQELSTGIPRTQVLANRLNHVMEQWTGDDRSKAQLRDMTIGRVIRFLQNDDPTDIEIGDTLLSRSEAAHLLKGDSGFGGTIHFERSREGLIQHITEDQQLARNYNYSFRQMGEVLTTIMVAAFTNEESAAKKITINNHTYDIQNLQTLSPGGLAFNYLEDEIVASWARWFVGDFIVTDENGKTFFFAGSSAKACMNRSYVEPKYADGAEEYRLNLGTFLEFFQIIPEGSSTQNIRALRLIEYEADLQSHDIATQYYGAMKLLDMNDRDGLSLVTNLFTNFTTKSIDESVMVMKAIKRIADEAKAETNSQILEYLRKLDFTGIREQNRDEFEQLRQDIIKQLDNPSR